MKILKVDAVDAQQMSVLHPLTFEVPTKQELDNIKVDDNVKISVNNERFWCEVKAILPNNVIIAKINNDLLQDELRCGQTITFEKRHIYSIYEK